MHKTATTAKGIEANRFSCHLLPRIAGIDTGEAHCSQPDSRSSDEQGIDTPPSLNPPKREMFQIDKKNLDDCFRRDPVVSVKSAYADYMSETSSVVSGLDETDYEVRKLTALAFRSLACPHNSYIDVYSTRTSSDLSLSRSEDSNSIKRSSTYVDLGFPGEDNTKSNSSAVCTLSTRSEESGNADSEESYGRAQFECVDVAVETREESKVRGESRTVPKREIQLKKRQRSELKIFTSKDATDCRAATELGSEMHKTEEAPNFPEKPETAPYKKETKVSVETKEEVNRQLKRAESMEECSKKAKFASCHISNVISKKMLFEQELKMERGVIQDNLPSVPSTPSSVNLKEFEFPQELRRQNSNSKSESDMSEEELSRSFRRKSYDLGEATHEKRSVLRQNSWGSIWCEGGLGLDGQPSRDIFNRGENSAFRNWKESNTDSIKGIKSGRGMGLCGEQSYLMLHGLDSVRADEKKANEQVVVDSDVDGIPHLPKEISQVSQSKQSKLTAYEDKISYKWSGSTSELKNQPRRISRSPEKTKALQMPMEKLNELFGSIELLSPNISSSSKVIPLDPKYHTLPASFKYETGDCKVKEPQFEIKDNRYLKQKGKGPIHHVRDVRKLVKNTYGALTFTDVKLYGSEQVFNPEDSEDATPDRTSSLNTLPLPIFIKYQSINHKGIRDNHLSVDKKYWTYAGSTDTSRMYSSDIKFLIPTDIMKNKVGSSRKTVIEKEGTEDLIHFTDMKTSKKEQAKDDKVQTSSTVKNEDVKASAMKAGSKTEAQVGGENLNKHLTGKICLNNESTNLSSERNKQKQNVSVHPKDKVKTDRESQIPSKFNAAKEDSNISPNKVSRQTEGQVKLHNQLGNTTSNTEANVIHGNSERNRDVRDRSEGQTKRFKISPSKNDDLKLSTKKNEPRTETEENPTAYTKDDLLTGKTKSGDRNEDGPENWLNSRDYCVQNHDVQSLGKRETKNELSTELEKQVKKGKAEQVQASEKPGLKPGLLRESQLVKDSYVLSLILEEERMKADKNSSEPSDSKIRNKQLSSVQYQIPNDPIPQPSPLVRTEDKEARSRQDLQKATRQVKFPKEHKTCSETVNYLAIPIKEQKPPVPAQVQTPTSPYSTGFKSSQPTPLAIPYFQRQQSWEIPNPHRQEKTLSQQVSQESQSPGTSLWNPYSLSQVPNPSQPQMLPFFPEARTLNFPETFCEVPQSAQDIDKAPVPSYQYPQTERKILVDPETGKYYFVDAPVQPSRKMLLDPETGQYVEVVMPQAQPTFGGLYQMPFSPYLLNPSVVAPSYLPNVPYPGLLVNPQVSSQRPPDMPSQQSGLHTNQADKQHHIHRSISAETEYMESLYYIPTGMTLCPNPTLPQVAMRAKSCLEVKECKPTAI
ncbi:uncharacterized protein C4orf54 homolog [Callorhinchus milii]|uniref:uncharacterized protein C4orf54 homolog n=1 Tax=Callorhinchus milii TaxID=7868 RepID=UPI001C3FA8E0|nr:uncharacterized protein C4orf54 homolog [Callorhinchus milii]